MKAQEEARHAAALQEAEQRLIELARVRGRQKPTAEWRQNFANETSLDVPDSVHELGTIDVIDVDAGSQTVSPAKRLRQLHRKQTRTLISANNSAQFENLESMRRTGSSKERSGLQGVKFPSLQRSTSANSYSNRCLVETAKQPNPLSITSKNFKKTTISNSHEISSSVGDTVCDSSKCIADDVPINASKVIAVVRDDDEWSDDSLIDRDVCHIDVSSHSNQLNVRYPISDNPGSTQTKASLKLESQSVISDVSDTDDDFQPRHSRQISNTASRRKKKPQSIPVWRLKPIPVRPYVHVPASSQM